jgi:hypothetical protein
MDDPGLDLRDWLLVILPFVGVIVGGLLSGGIELWLRRSHEHGDRRLGARIVHDELSTAYGLLVAAKQQKAAALLPDAKRVVGAWQQHRPSLRSLELGDWQPIQGAIAAVELFALLFGEQEVWLDEFDHIVPSRERDLEAGIESSARFR